MANANTTGFGLRMIERVGNTPATSGQSEYPVKSALGVGIYKGRDIYKGRGIYKGMGIYKGRYHIDTT